MIFLKEEFPPHYLSSTKAGRTNVNFKIEKRKSRTSKCDRQVVKISKSIQLNSEDRTYFTII